jgi:hypothetical protein
LEQLRRDRLRDIEFAERSVDRLFGGEKVGRFARDKFFAQQSHGRQCEYLYLYIMIAIEYFSPIFLQNEHFSFLGTQASLKAMKCRTTFYTALTRLLSVELTDEVEEFQRFMAPLQSFFLSYIFAYGSD